MFGMREAEGAEPAPGASTTPGLARNEQQKVVTGINLEVKVSLQPNSCMMII